MKPIRKTFRQALQPENDILASFPNVVKPSNSKLRKRKITTTRRSASVSASRNSSTQAFKCVDYLPVSTSMKTICLKEDKQALCRNIMAKNLRVMAKKKRELVQLRTTLMEQQEIFIELFAQVKDLEILSGVDPSKSIGEAQLVSVKGWSGYDLLMLARGDPKLFGHTDIKGIIGPATLKELNSLLSKIPEEVLNMGADLMALRLEILQYLRARVRADGTNFQDWKMKNAKFDSDTKNLHKLVVEVAKNLETKIEQSLELAKIPWRDRDMLIRKLECLQKQFALWNIRTAGPLIEQKQSMSDQCVATDLFSSSYWRNIQDELEKERAAGESLREVVTSAEAMLRSSRQRVNILERQLKDTRTQLEESIRKHKEYEQLHRNRETRYDARSRKLMQVSKTGEVTIEVLSRQRDALELRVKELQEQTMLIAQDYEARMMEQKSRMESIQAKMGEQEKRRNIAETRVLELEKRLKDLQEEHNKLRECSNKLANFDKEKYLDFLPRKENEPSRVETDLWKDLLTTRLNLERVTQELKQSRADKESLLDSLARIAQEGPEHKMADELLLREQKITRFQRDIEELKETIKTMQETVKQKDRQLTSLRMQVGQKMYDCFGNKNATTHELEIEVMDLTSKVATLEQERDSLVSAAASNALMLERHERCADLFAQMDPSLRKSLSSVCLKASETWSELKTERERVLQLQNIIVTQNLQMERESCIRTLLEERRAVLERIFHASEHLQHNNDLPVSDLPVCDKAIKDL